MECIMDCDRRHYAKGWCKFHYTLVYRWGAPVDTSIRRFFNRVDQNGPGGCWIWNGARRPAGYGVLSFNGRYQAAHRVAYEMLVGPIPDGLHIDHLCRVTSCVNPAHLEPVTQAENNFRSRTSQCRRGHVRTVENTYVYPDGSRCCRDCRRVR